MQITDKMVAVFADEFWSVNALTHYKAEKERIRAALEAALSQSAALAGQDGASLDERMKAAGMIPLSDLLAGNTPLEKWMAHTGVRDLDSFEQWLTGKHREFMTMRVAYELGDKDESDELYEWVFAHAAAFGEVAANFRAMKDRSTAPAGVQVKALEAEYQRRGVKIIELTEWAGAHLCRAEKAEARVAELEAEIAAMLSDEALGMERNSNDELVPRAAPPAAGVQAVPVAHQTWGQWERAQQDAERKK